MNYESTLLSPVKRKVKKKTRFPEAFAGFFIQKTIE